MLQNAYYVLVSSPNLASYVVYIVTLYSVPNNKSKHIETTNKNKNMFQDSNCAVRVQVYCNSPSVGASASSKLTQAHWTNKPETTLGGAVSVFNTEQNQVKQLSLLLPLS